MNCYKEISNELNLNEYKVLADILRIFYTDKTKTDKLYKTNKISKLTYDFIMSNFPTKTKNKISIESIYIDEDDILIGEQSTYVFKHDFPSNLDFPSRFKIIHKDSNIININMIWEKDRGELPNKVSLTYLHEENYNYEYIFNYEYMFQYRYILDFNKTLIHSDDLNSFLVNKTWATYKNHKQSYKERKIDQKDTRNYDKDMVAEHYVYKNGRRTNEKIYKLPNVVEEYYLNNKITSYKTYKWMKTSETYDTDIENNVVLINDIGKFDFNFNSNTITFDKTYKIYKLLEELKEKQNKEKVKALLANDKKDVFGNIHGQEIAKYIYKLL